MIDAGAVPRAPSAAISLAQPASSLKRKWVRLRVLYHGNCFDGCSSAGIFSRFYKEKVARGDVEVLFRPLEHKGEAHPFPSDCFDGDENVCVDFRYSQDPRLSWWFDHHASAFQLPGDEAHFRADATGRKFYDPAAKSCAKFVARVLSGQFGWDAKPLTELIEWAEIIAGALYPSAAMAVELRAPGERRHRLRPGRQGRRGVQQVHRLLPVPGGALFGGGDPGRPRQGVGRIEPLVAGAAHASDQRDLRAVWRRRAPRGGGGLGREG